MRWAIVSALALLLQGCVTATWQATCAGGEQCSCQALYDGTVQCGPEGGPVDPGWTERAAPGAEQWSDEVPDLSAAANPERQRHTVVTPEMHEAWSTAHDDP